MAALPRITVHGGEHDRVQCPLSVDLPVSYSDDAGFELRDTRGRRALTCQAAPTRQGVKLTFIVETLKAGQAKSFRLARCKKVPPDRVKLIAKPGEDQLDISILGKPFTCYHYGDKWVRPFLHPVLGPGNVAVTRNWPVQTGIKGETRDHRHHKSIWVAYGECGTVDNWSEEKGHGWQRHRRFRSLTSGPVFGAFVEKVDWCAANERKQFEETRTMRFYALPGGVRLFDVDVAFRMSEKQVTFHDTKEGGLISVRVASSMDVSRGGRIENGYGGVNERETWGKSAPWCDYSGFVNGQHVGIAVMDHETNPRYPTGWHVRDYGLMTANCFAWSYYRPEAKRKGDMTFRKGSTTCWRYRLYIHRGDARKGKVRERFMDFVAPPRVTVG